MATQLLSQTSIFSSVFCSNSNGVGFYKFRSSPHVHHVSVSSSSFAMGKTDQSISRLCYLATDLAKSGIFFSRLSFDEILLVIIRFCLFGSVISSVWHLGMVSDDGEE